MKQTSVHIFFGGNEYNDHDELKAAAKSGEELDWSAVKKVAAGDRILIYCDQPDSAFVASAEAMTDAERAEDYPYRCQIGKIRMLRRPIPRAEVQQLLPEWRWAKATRGRATVEPEIQEQVWETLNNQAEQAPGFVSTGFQAPEEDDETDPAASVEGRLRETWSSVRERSRKNRAACIRALPPEQRDAPRCAVCGMTFLDRYGEIGRRFIHVHHMRPAASLNSAGELVVPAEDLAAVCPNCHAMLHIAKNAAKGEVRSVQELQKLMNAVQNRAPTT